MSKRETIYLYDRYGNPIPFEIDFETRIGRDYYAIAENKNARDGVGYVLREIHIGKGEFEYELIQDRTIISLVYEEYNKASDNSYDDCPLPTTLYLADEIVDVDFDDEFDLNSANGQSLHFIKYGGISHNGKTYLLTETDFYDPNLPRGTHLAFEIGKNGNLTVVEDGDLADRLFASYDEEEEKMFNGDDDEDFNDDEFGSKSSGSFEKARILQDQNGKRFPFRKVALIDIGKNAYMILNPQFQMDGIDPDDAFVYRLAGTKDNRHLELVLDEEINDKVFAEYDKIFDAKHRVGVKKGDDDDFFM